MLATPTTTYAELGTGTVADAMSAGVLTCPPETPLRSVARMMATYRVHCIVVWTRDEDCPKPWGVVSDMDLVSAVGRATTAGCVAASPIVSVAPETPLLDAARRMTETASAHLLVVDPDNALPIGVLSSLDVARALAAEAGPTEYFGS